jgi:hypothetical protein
MAQSSFTLSNAGGKSLDDIQQAIANQRETQLSSRERAGNSACGLPPVLPCHKQNDVIITPRTAVSEKERLATEKERELSAWQHSLEEREQVFHQQ